MKNIISSVIAVCLGSSLWIGCSSGGIKPVDFFPEDNCSNCRMALSSRAFASEIITEGAEVMKFDDLACLEGYRKKNPALKIKAIFVVDYESGQWLPFEKSVIVKTGFDTPMGSGKLAVKDTARAAAIAKEHPPATDLTAADCCSHD
jgi:copper chaperone NosL